MSTCPTVDLDTEFDNIRLYLSQSTIDDLAYKKGLRRVGGLVQPHFCNRDLIMFCLAKLVVPALATSHLVSSAFIEHLALALHEHVITLYGGVPGSARRRGSHMAPWQIRRIKDFIESNLANNPSISEFARGCDVSTSSSLKNQ